jgi:hypothetical protein
MTLNDLLLQKLNDWRPDSARTPLVLADGKTSLSLTADQNERLACRIWELTLTRQDAPGDLKDWAERTCKRVTGLLEPLRLVEVDAEHQVAQVRSEGPSKRGASLCYYELLLKGSKEIVVRRFDAATDASRKREQAGFVLTHEALAKLVADLLAA